MSRKEWIAVVGVAIAAAFLSGYYTHQPKTRIETKEVVKWQTRTESTAQASAASAKNEQVRVVTRWLRPDKTVAREQILSRGTVSTKLDSSVSRISSEAQGDTARVSKSVTGSAPRFHVAGMLGLDLRAELKREWGVAASYRIVGPVTVGAFYLPGMAGASVGLTF